MSSDNLLGMAKYTQDQIDRWIATFKTGKSYRQVADEFDANYSTVFWHIKKALGLPGRRPGRKKVHVGKTDAEISRMWQLQNNYGITVEEYNDMLEKQGGCCAICRRPPRGGNTCSRNLHVDHDHVTGKVRGLLCNYCNPALGKFQDSPALLRAAAAYLEAPGA